MADHHDDVLQRVGGGPRATIATGELGTAVEVVDKRGDRRRVRRVVDRRGRQVVGGPVGWRSDVHGLDIGGKAAVRAAHEGVLTTRDRRQELLTGRPTHRPGHRRDDDERHAEALERLDVSVAVALVRHSEPVIVEIEAVGVLHHELATAQQSGSGTCFVAVLRLDLVDDEGQVLVRRVQILDEQREHLLVRRSEEEVVAAAVLEPEDPVAVLDPPTRCLVGRLGQERREVDLLEPRRVHLGADDVLDVAVHQPPERQPREPPWRGSTDVAGARQQLVAGDLGIGRVLTQRPQEQGRHPQHAGHDTGSGGSASVPEVSADRRPERQRREPARRPAWPGNASDRKAPPDPVGVQRVDDRQPAVALDQRPIADQVVGGSCRGSR